MANYNMTWVESTTNFLHVVEGVNDNTGGGFAGLLMLVVFIVIMIVTLRNNDVDVALLVSSFVTSIVSLLFFIIGLIGVEIFVIPLVVLVISLFIKVASR